MQMGRAIVGLLLALCLGVTLPAPARAQTAQAKAAAEELFELGKKLHKEGKYLEAARKLEESQRLDAGVGTLLWLGESYKKAGRLASAWASFREAASLAKAKGDDRREVAEQRAKELKDKISKLTVNLDAVADVAGLKVVRGKVALDVGMSGVPLPVDAGTYQLEVSAPGYETHRQSIEVPPEGKSVTVDVPALTPAPEPPPGEGELGPEPDTKPPPDEDDGVLGVHYTSAIGLGAVAVVAAGLSIGFTAHAAATDSAADGHCDGTACRDQEGVDLSDEAVLFANLATGGVVLAGAAAGAGLILLLTAPSNEAGSADSGAADAAGLSVRPALGPSFAGVFAGGRW